MKSTQNSSVKTKAFEFELSIVVPAYNEENRIKSTLVNIFDFIAEKKINAEIIVVNDGSTDRTAEQVSKKKARIKHLKLINKTKNQGKGAAIKTGVTHARGRNILITDADNSTPIEQWESLNKALEAGADISIGSRYLTNSEIQIKQPLLRVMISRLGNLVIRILIVRGIKDTQCGFKLFRNEVAQAIFSKQKIKRWGFDIEVLAVARLLNYKVKEVPVSWFNSVDSRIRPIRDTYRTFLELLQIKSNLLRGVYK